jgi:hypothetical protein
MQIEEDAGEKPEVEPENLLRDGHQERDRGTHDGSEGVGDEEGQAALLRLIGRRHADAEPLVQGSDGQREFVERDRHPLVHWLLRRRIWPGRHG